MILGITPARGGSKGIPRKNLRLLQGKPLLAWTVAAAQKANLLDRYVVSTEDSEIAEAVRSLGAEVLERPADLARDESTTLDVLRHALEQIPADTVVVLQATSPVRDEGLIDDCIRRFKKSGADSLATGFRCKFVEYGKNNLPRQGIDGFFYDDGNVYVIKADIIRAGDRYGRKMERVEIDREQNVEIDEAFDFWLADHVMAKRRIKP